MDGVEGILALIFGAIALYLGVKVFLWMLPYLLLAAAAAVGTAALWGIIARREAIARWYYFTFHPHPAAPIVRDALKTGTRLDGRALAAELAELPPGNSIFRKVRLEQAEKLVTEMQVMSRAHVREYERTAAEGYERAAVYATQEAVALAAVALEKAKAAWRTAEAILRVGSR